MGSCGAGSEGTAGHADEGRTGARYATEQTRSTGKSASKPTHQRGMAVPIVRPVPADTELKTGLDRDAVPHPQEETVLLLLPVPCVALDNSTSKGAQV